MKIKNIIKDVVQDVTKELAIILCDELRFTLRREKLKAKELRGIRRRRPLKPRRRCQVKKLNVNYLVDYKNRISVEKFEELFEKVSCKIQKQNTLMREALPARVKLNIVLHYLTTGDNFQTLSELYKVPKNSISQFLPDVCDAIFQGLQEYMQIPHSAQDWKKIQHGFESKWNFPTCFGAVDGCHIAVRCAKDCPQNSISLTCVVDAEYRFIHVEIKKHEDVKDVTDFTTTPLSKFISEINLPERGTFVANSSFPLTDSLLTPYEAARLTPIQNVFNYRLERASKVAENALGVLLWKFRVFDRPSPLKMNTIEKALKAMCALHNWLLDTTILSNPGCLDYEDIATGTVIPGKWRQKTTIKKIYCIKRDSHPSTIFKRHTYASRFIVKDILPWQWKMADAQPVTF